MAREWDRLAWSYRGQESLERPSLDAVVDLGRPVSTDVAVDLACGPGTLARHLDRRGLVVRRLLGVDTSSEMLVRAEAAGMQPICADVTAVPLPDGVADLVVCSFVLHLVDDSTRSATVTEVRRLLAPSGRAVLVVPAEPRSRIGRGLRRVLRSTVARGTLGVVDLDPAIVASGVEVTADRDVGDGRWGYCTRVVRVRRPGPAGGDATDRPATR